MPLENIKSGTVLTPAFEKEKSQDWELRLFYKMDKVLDKKVAWFLVFSFAFFLAQLIAAAI